MAYGNWGAFVRRNGERMKNHEDATPYKENDYPSGYHQAFGIASVGVGEDGKPAAIKKPDTDLHCHHATLGSGRVRLCGYKHYPVLFVDRAEVDLSPFRVADCNEEHPTYRGAVEGHEFRAEQSENFVELYLKDPDGAVWTSTCGFEFGAGFDE